jgi:hypothetical protein
MKIPIGILTLLLSSLFGHAQTIDTVLPNNFPVEYELPDEYAHHVGLRVMPTLWQESTNPKGLGIGLLYRAIKPTHGYRAGFNWVNFESGGEVNSYKRNDTTVLVQSVDHATDLYDVRFGREWYMRFGRINIHIGADAIVGVREKRYWLSEEHYEYYTQEELSRYEDSEPFFFPVEKYLQFGIRPTLGLQGILFPRLQVHITAGPDLVISTPISDYISVPGTSYNERHMLLVQFALTYQVRGRRS